MEMLCSARHQIKREMDFFTRALKILFSSAAAEDQEMQNQAGKGKKVTT